MNKEELLNYNIMVGAELLLNCYYDEVLEEPQPLEDWINYVYHEITKNFHTPDYIEMGNNVIRFFGEKEIKERTKKYLLETNRFQKYIIA